MPRTPEQEARRAFTDATVQKAIDELQNGDDEFGGGGNAEAANMAMVVLCAVSRVQQAVDELADTVAERMSAQTAALNRIAAALERANATSKAGA